MPSAKFVFLIHIIAFPLMMVMAGCAGTTPQALPLAPAGLSTQSRTYLGTPLSGPLADAAPPDGTGAPTAVVSFFALQKVPATTYEPLAPRLIVATSENSPVIPTPHLVGTVRLIDPDHNDNIMSDVHAGKFGPSALIWTGQAALLQGATAAFSVSESRGSADADLGAIPGRGIELDLNRSADSDAAGHAGAVAAAIGIDGPVNTAPPREIEEAFKANQPAPAAARRGVAARPPPPAPPPMVLQSEMALFDRHAAPDSFALLAPMRFENSLTQAVLVVVQISPGAENAAHQKLVAQALSQIQDASQTAARQANLIGTDPTDWPGLSSAVESLAFSSRQRAGLVFLSQQTNAHITQDVALAVDDAILSDLAGAVTRAIAAAPGAVDRASIGWVLERTTLQILMQIQSGPKPQVELTAILAERAGQAGRNAGTLQEVLSNATSRQDMENRLAAENYIFLEDSSPAARVRAFDWLVARHLAPPGYDPLALPKPRRDALERAEQAAPR